MEKETDLQDWYRCAQPPVVVEAETNEEEPLDLFEEAGLYPEPEPMYSPWTPEEQKPKKRRWGRVLGGLLGAAALVALIVGTSVFFTREDNDGRDDRDWVLDDTWDYFDRAFTQTITGENSIERAPVTSAVRLEFTALPEGEEAPEPLSLDALYDQCLPSVVAVRGYTGFGYVWGSGIVMTENGYILTNTHMLDGVESVEVTLHDGSSYDARLVGNDAVTDVAVLKIEARGLTPARFADSDALNVGDPVVAIGNPLSDVFTGTMTEGIVSGKERSVSYGGRTMTLLQHTAAINEGNSGGPLFDRYGRVVGIINMKMMTTRTATVEGIGFAIPMTTVRDIANALLSEGVVAGRPALGVYVYETADDGTHPAGLLVNNAVEGSDAEAKGILPGDILTAIDGEAITDFDVVSRHLAALEVGGTVRLTVWREGVTLEVDVTLMDQNDI